MSACHLVQVPLALGALGRWAAERDLGWATRRGHVQAFDEGRALHHLLAESFGKAMLQPFRLLVTPGGQQGSLYAYSEADAPRLVEAAAAFMAPEVQRVIDPGRLASKPMPEAWREGRRLAFDVRVCPVRRLMKPLPRADGGSFASGREVDAFLVEALRQFPDPPTAEGGMLAAGRDRATVYAEWLGEQLAPAADLAPDVRLAAFSRRRIARDGAGGERPDAVLQGELVVRDPALFAQRLRAGIGRHRAYGFGMLMLRPPARGRC